MNMQFLKCSFKNAVLKGSQKNNIPSWLTMGLIRQESRFNKKIISSAGAIGLMQILPRTALEINNNARIKINLVNPDENIKLGTKYLSNLMKRFNGSIPISLAAYNAGPSRAKKWKANKRHVGNEPAMFVESIPFQETREYVQTVILSSAIYKELFSTASHQSEIHKRNVIIYFNQILNTL